MIKKSLMGAAQGLPILGLLTILVVAPVLFPEQDSLAGVKPQNVPTFTVYTEEAQAVCDGPIVPTGRGVVAADVVVVMQNGDVVLMDTTEAHDRFRSKTEADDAWPIAVCADHVQEIR